MSRIDVEMYDEMIVSGECISTVHPGTPANTIHTCVTVFCDEQYKINMAVMEFYELQHIFTNKYVRNRCACMCVWNRVKTHINTYIYPSPLASLHTIIHTFIVLLVP